MQRRVKTLLNFLKTGEQRRSGTENPREKKLFGFQKAN